MEANTRVNVETLGRELNMDMVSGEANSPACVAWLSRLPIRSSTNHNLPELAKTLLEVEVLWDDAPLRLFATHLADRREEVIRPRQAEVQAIVGVLRTIRAEPHLLVGDFNALVAGDPVGQPPSGVEKTGDALPDALRTTLQHLFAAGYVDCYRVLHPRVPGYTSIQPITPGYGLTMRSRSRFSPGGSFIAKSIGATLPGAPRTIFRWLCISRDTRKVEVGSTRWSAALHGARVARVG